MTFREKVYEQYLQTIQDKISLLWNTLNDLRESSGNETKSSAGDKHETALAMLHIEQENISQQLKEAFDQKAAFEKINPGLFTPEISTGSLIKTNNGYLFLSVALGKIVIDGSKVIAISPQSPLGQGLVGLKVNEVVKINGMGYVIESIT